MAEERERIASEKADLQRALSDERGQLLAMRAELEQSVAEQRAEIERVAMNDRQLIDSLRAELKAAGEAEIEKKRETALEDISDEPSVMEASELDTPAFIPMVAPPLPEIAFEHETPLADAAEPPLNEIAEQQPQKKRSWFAPIAFGGAVVLIVVAVIAFATRRTPEAQIARVAAPAVAPAIPTSVVPLPTAPIIVVDSAAGSIGPVLDSATPAVALAPAPKAKKRLVQRDTAAGHDTLFQIRRDTIRKRDSTISP